MPCFHHQVIANLMLDGHIYGPMNQSKSTENKGIFSIISNWRSKLWAKLFKFCTWYTLSNKPFHCIVGYIFWSNGRQTKLKLLYISNVVNFAISIKTFLYLTFANRLFGLHSSMILVFLRKCWDMYEYQNQLSKMFLRKGQVRCFILLIYSFISKYWQQILPNNAP